MAVLGNSLSEVITDTFEENVLEGLSSQPKHLSSKYFYDKTGDELFVEITKLPEYYLTDAENEIFNDQRAEILEAFKLNMQKTEIVELGAGDGHKAAFLLAPLRSKDNVEFAPVDISQNTLNVVVERFKREIPELRVRPIPGEYFSVLTSLNPDRRKIVLFLGSNIGNLNQKQASNFINRLSTTLKKGDMLLLGVDLKKSADIILPAYNDSSGVTKKFNLNLLHRINRELGGNFDVTKFTHDPEYDEIEGEARSYIKSLEDQHVFIDSLHKSFYFKKEERIHTEISQKYDDKKVHDICSASGLEIIKKFTDKRGYFADYLLEKTNLSDN